MVNTCTKGLCLSILDIICKLCILTWIDKLMICILNAILQGEPQQSELSYEVVGARLTVIVHVYQIYVLICDTYMKHKKDLETFKKETTSAGYSAHVFTICISTTLTLGIPN